MGEAPLWLPSSVGSATRRGKASNDDLLSGRAWEQFLSHLSAAGDVLGSDRAPSAPLERAGGYRHLLTLLALGIDEALRPSDPYDPQITPGNVDAVLKWGMDCPDAAYVGSAIHGDATYRLTGWRGTVRYLGFQVMGGMESTANVVAGDLPIESDGTFELMLSAEPQPGNWMPLAPKASSFVVRQFFYDWEREDPARLRIECLDHPPSAVPPTPTPEAVARQLVALGQFVEASLGFWLDIEEAGRGAGLNAFREPNARTDLGGAAENVSVWGSWQLDEGEALLIEVTPPPALYWSVALGNYWWETLDYANHQASLNGYQATLDDDGVFRAVVCHRDPGVANWLDTCGYGQGPMIFRWLRAEETPVPRTSVIAFDGLGDHLPGSTRRVDAKERQETIAARRRGTRRRFTR
jgi:hypothetical protein